MGEKHSTAESGTGHSRTSSAGQKRRNAKAALKAAKEDVAKAQTRETAIASFHQACDVIDSCNDTIAENIIARDAALLALRENSMRLIDIAKHTGMSTSYISARIKRARAENTS